MRSRIAKIPSQFLIFLQYSKVCVAWPFGARTLHKPFLHGPRVAITGISPLQSKGRCKHSVSVCPQMFKRHAHARNRCVRKRPRESNNNLQSMASRGLFLYTLSNKHSIQNFYSYAFKAYQRIGPHKKEILDTIVGSLLGDGWGEKRCGSTRFHFHYTSKNVEYLEFLHVFFATNGYCSSKTVKKTRQIGKFGKIYYSIKLRTFSFSSWNWLYDLFYSSVKQKHVPKNISELLSPRALAIWIMDDGGVSGKGSKISTESFTLEEVKLLQAALFERFDLRYSIQRHKEKHILYLSKEQMPALQRLVQRYMLPCMYYKLNIQD